MDKRTNQINKQDKQAQSNHRECLVLTYFFRFCTLSYLCTPTNAKTKNLPYLFLPLTACRENLDTQKQPRKIEAVFQLFFNGKFINRGIIVGLTGVQNTIRKSLVIHTVGHTLRFKTEEGLNALIISALKRMLLII